MLPVGTYEVKILAEAGLSCTIDGNHSVMPLGANELEGVLTYKISVLENQRVIVDVRNDTEEDVLFYCTELRTILAAEELEGDVTVSGGDDYEEDRRSGV